jgi:hypothetical protein
LDAENRAYGIRHQKLEELKNPVTDGTFSSFFGRKPENVPSVTGFSSAGG